jgi:hypothetical protein
MCNIQAEYSYIKCLQIYKLCCFSTITDERYTYMDKDKAKTQLT